MRGAGELVPRHRAGDHDDVGNGQAGADSVKQLGEVGVGVLGRRGGRDR